MTSSKQAASRIVFSGLLSVQFMPLSGSGYTSDLAVYSVSYMSNMIILTIVSAHNKKVATHFCYAFFFRIAAFLATVLLLLHLKSDFHTLNR